MRPTLDELAIKHGSDKASQVALDWQWPMNYCHTYDQLFTPLRDKPITLLELGWGEWDPERKDHANPDNGGRSARMWRDYFAQADIHVVDIHHKNNPINGVTFHQGSQDDPKFLGQVHEAAGDFDIIIDDASHVSSLTVASFRILWPMLKPGGYYCIEDLHHAYHDYFFEKSEANRDPRKNTHTTMGFLHDILDDVHYRGERMKGPAVDGDPRSWDCYPRKYWRGHTIESISFTYQLCVIRKSP